jgi:hypothetical protein
MNEDASQSTASSTTTSDSTVMLTSKVPTLHKQKLNVPMLVSADEMSKVLTVNYMSQFRKRPSMTDSGKEIQDSSFHGPFSKRPTPDHQDFKTSMPKMDVDESDRRGNLNSESDSVNLETKVMAASGCDSGNKFTSSDRYWVTLKDCIRRPECKSVTNMDATLESDKIQNTAVEGSNYEKDIGMELKRKLMEEDTDGLHVLVAQGTEACVTLNDSNIQCQRSETNIARTELKVCSSEELRQQKNTDESAKSDKPATRDNCESLDNRQSPTSEPQKGDSSATDSHQIKHNCDLCGKVQSSQESLQKVC